MIPEQSPTPKSNQLPSKKVYSREFKLGTEQLLKSSGKHKADLERELGLYIGQIHLWERAFNKKEKNVRASLSRCRSSE